MKKKMEFIDKKIRINTVSILQFLIINLVRTGDM